MKTKLIAVALTVLITVTLAAQQQPKASGVLEPDAKIIAKLAEIVQLREQLLAIEQALHQSGRDAAANGSGVGMAEIALAEAKGDLAREQGRKDALIAALQDLVAAHEKRVKWAQSMKNLARASDVGVKQAQAALLKAQVRLLREQK